MLSKRVLQRGAAEGFGDMPAETAGQILLHLMLHRMGGHRQRWRLRRARFGLKRADRGKRADPVKHRHRDVQQQEIEGTGAVGFQRNLAVLGQRDRHTQPGQHGVQDEAVGAVVIGHQNPQA